MFFTGIVVRQKAVSEKQLELDVVEILDSILVGAEVSEDTKNFIGASGLSDLTFYFNCEEDVGEFGIKDGASLQNAITPIFAPLEIKTKELITWSLPYRLPYKVVDLLFVSSESTLYVLLGEGQFAIEFINATNGFSVEQESSLLEVKPGEYFQVRLIDLYNSITAGMPVPNNLLNRKVTVINFPSDHEAQYFEAKNGVWVNTGITTIVSIEEDRNAAKYAAIFSENKVTYECNMRKAWERLQYVTEVYTNKLNEIAEYYRANPSDGGRCLGYISESSESMDSRLSLHKVTSTCWQLPENLGRCYDLINSAQKIKEINHDLTVNCVPLY